MGKRKRVPEVLWRMFGSRARTLSEAIISLIPQHCDCNGRGKCLRCVFGVGDEAAMAYLIRPDDLQEYRQLMMTCFVVIPTDAPPLPPLLSFSLRWSQPQIVERTIEALFSKQAANANVICSGYEKITWIILGFSSNTKLRKRHSVPSDATRERGVTSCKGVQHADVYALRFYKEFGLGNC
ncbi:hypothetical protein Cgig2_031697 [Carnegiea gigantea]|uniref:Telomerase reverse transcriptase n=1 Tax=Carnegiea gigantea TaxID=171969 RepID=A0A9Q1QM15_9CARY|nr:hypothetical protein Cgig2_031697 [Carnegiea gigantea]